MAMVSTTSNTAAHRASGALHPAHRVTHARITTPYIAYPPPAFGTSVDGPLIDIPSRSGRVHKSKISFPVSGPRASFIRGTIP